jgi:uncharacterized cupredoxin-like copper-binding protein
MTKTLAGLAAAAVLVLAACGDDSTASKETTAKSAQGAQIVTVTGVSDYKFEVSSTKLKAGSTTFKFTNNDDKSHEMVLFKTDLATDKLPADAATGKVDEEGAGITTLGEVPEVGQSESGELTADLTPGTYLLVCNVVEKEADGTEKSHFTHGMHATLTVA